MPCFVLDTNVWLDWLVFDDPAVAPLKSAVAGGRAEIRIDPACEAALAARADFLVTKDGELLALGRRSLPFRIIPPDAAA